MSLPLNQIIQGDCVEVMRDFPEESIDMAMFSPPYWGLRDYGVEGQIGLEKHPNDWIARMVLVCGEVKRVIKKSGSLYLNVGDTYYGSGKGRGTTTPSKNLPYEECHPSVQQTDRSNWLQPKQKLLMPSRLAIALQEEGWILRNDIIWHKPNHMPSSVKDRLTCAYEHIFHFVKQRRYFYDLDAIRQPHKAGVTRWGGQKMKVPSKQKEQQGLSKALLNEERNWRNPLGKNPSDIIKHDIAVGRVGNFSYTDPLHVKPTHPKGKNPSDIITKGEDCYGVDEGRRKRVLEHLHKTPHDELAHPKGKNPSDFWSINTRPFPQAHFAVYPEKICEMPIKSSCPQWVCRGCGKPKTRITKTKYLGDTPTYEIEVRKFKPNLKEIAKYIKFWRKKRNLSRKELDSMMGTNTSIAWWEGRNYLGEFLIQLPSIGNWKKLKKILSFDNKFDEVMTTTKKEKRFLEPQTKVYDEQKAVRSTVKRWGNGATRETVGWSSCKCNAGFDAGIVLDPMCGAGTTLVVAQKLGRRWIGIDLKAEYVEMAKKRLMRECSQKLTKFLESE